MKKILLFYGVDIDYKINYYIDMNVDGIVINVSIEDRYGGKFLGDTCHIHTGRSG